MTALFAPPEKNLLQQFVIGFDLEIICARLKQRLGNISHLPQY